jgi:hypothetical protein
VIRSTYPFCRAHILVSIGYPPSDATLRSWLLSGEISDKTLGAVRKRLRGFVYALLTVTRTALETIDGDREEGEMAEEDVIDRQAKLASTFRERMTEGQSYQGPNDYREDFYKKVTQEADKVSFRAFPHFGEDDSFPKFIEGGRQINDPKAGNRVEEAGKQLAQFVDPRGLLDHHEDLPRRPLVIFAFDEAHILTDNPPRKNKAAMWNLFSELRRILRDTSDLAIFSIFLSTAGRFNLSSPVTSSDPSMRIQGHHLGTLDPITEISFDELAYDAPEYTVMLERVVEMDWMCHLGRPLYALFGYHFSEQLTYHLEQVRVHLRRRGEPGQKRTRAYGPREGEVAGWSAYAWGRSAGFSSLPLCALRA